MTLQVIGMDGTNLWTIKQFDEVVDKGHEWMIVSDLQSPRAFIGRNGRHTIPKSDVGKIVIQ